MSRIVPIARSGAGLALILAACGAEDPPLSGPPADDEAETEAGDESESADAAETETRATRDDDETLSDSAATEGSSDEPSESAQCEVPEFAVGDELLPFATLEASVVDQSGNGVAATTAQVCGLNLCLFGQTDDVGFIRYDQPAELKRVAFKYGDGLRHAQFARLLADGADHELGPQVTVALPALAEASALEAGEVVSSGEVTLDLTGTAPKIDLLSFPDEEEHVFVAAELEPALWPEAVPSDLGLQQLVALGPLKTTFCPPAQLTLPNTPEWPAGTEIDVLLHIVDTANHWGAYGTFSQVASARVTEDGSQIVTDPDAGLPELGVIGLRVAE